MSKELAGTEKHLDSYPRCVNNLESVVVYILTLFYCDLWFSLPRKEKWTKIINYLRHAVVNMNTK